MNLGGPISAIFASGSIGPWPAVRMTKTPGRPWKVAFAWVYCASWDFFSLQWESFCSFLNTNSQYFIYICIIFVKLFVIPRKTISPGSFVELCFFFQRKYSGLIEAVQCFIIKNDNKRRFDCTEISIVVYVSVHLVL